MCRELVPRPAHYIIWGCRSPIHKTAKYLHTTSTYTYPPAYFKLQYLIQCKWMLCKYLLHCFVVGIMTSLYMFRCSHNSTCTFSRHKLRMHSQQMTLFSYATIYLTQINLMTMLVCRRVAAQSCIPGTLCTYVELGNWVSDPAFDKFSQHNAWCVAQFCFFRTFWNLFQYFYSSQVIT